MLPIKFVLLTPASMAVSPVNVETRNRRKPRNPENAKIITARKISTIIEIS